MEGYLADERFVFVVAEVHWQYLLREGGQVFDGKAVAVGTPGDAGCVLWILCEGRGTLRILKVLSTKAEIE
jgi:hypothetical protein